MPSAEDLKQAGQDVLRYHSRRVYFPTHMFPKDQSIICLICVGSMIMSWVGVGIFPMSPILGVISGLCFPLCFTGVGIKYGGEKPTRKEAEKAALKYNKAIHLLIHSPELEAVGPLLEALGLPDITAYVPLALRRLLPQLQPQHAVLLNSKQRNDLLDILTQPDSHDLELQRATAQALGNIGDAKALPALEQLVGGAWGAVDSLNLREDARTALFLLQERINPGYAGRNLLRASDAPVTPADVLLRPATGNSETPPQELLRARNVP